MRPRITADWREQLALSNPTDIARQGEQFPQLSAEESEPIRLHHLYTRLMGWSGA